MPPLLWSQPKISFKFPPRSKSNEKIIIKKGREINPCTIIIVILSVSSEEIQTKSPPTMRNQKTQRKKKRKEKKKRKKTKTQIVIHLLYHDPPPNIPVQYPVESPCSLVCSIWSAVLETCFKSSNGNNSLPLLLPWTPWMLPYPLPSPSREKLRVGLNSCIGNPVV